MRSHPKSELLVQLRDKIVSCERATHIADVSAISTGVLELDRILPAGGIRPGMLIEWLDDRSGCGAESLALMFARTMCRDGGQIVVIDGDGQFYPPAMLAAGVSYRQLLVVRVRQDAEALWAADQALRNPAVGAVWLRQDRLRSHDFRRLRLAAGSGTAIGLLFRPARVRGQPSWADVQFAVRPLPATPHRRVRVEVTRCRGGTAGARVEVQLEGSPGFPPHETHRVFAVAALVGATAASRTAGVARPDRLVPATIGSR